MSAAIRPLPHKITTNIENVTPDIAFRWLTEHNTWNRDISQIRVDGYVREMTEGRWRFNGEGIQFDWNGVLLNGQHRLSAIVESETTQTFLIVRGLDPQTQITMDQGTRRAPDDQLKIAHIDANKTVAAAIRLYLQWTRGRFFGDQVRLKISTGEVVEWAQANPAAVEFLRGLSPNRLAGARVVPSITAAVWYRLSEIDAEDAGEFIGAVCSGVGEVTSPTHVLREKFTRNKESGIRMSPRDVVGFYVQAWNAFRAGRSITKLQRPKGGSWTVHTFPEPK